MSPTAMVDVTAMVESARDAMDDALEGEVLAREGSLGIARAALAAALPMLVEAMVAQLDRGHWAYATERAAIRAEGVRIAAALKVRS